MAQLSQWSRSSRLHVLRLVLAFGIVGFVCAGIYIGLLLMQRQSALDPIGRGNISWLIAQTPAEYARLEQRISAYGMGDGGVDSTEVKLRFDIVTNRLNTLRSAFLADFVSSDPRHAETIGEFEQVIADARPLISDLAAPGTPARLLELLGPLYPKLVRLSVDANSWNAARNNADRADLFHLQWVFAWVAGGLIVTGLLFVVLLLVHNGMLKRAYQQLHRKDEALQTQNHWFDAALNNMSRGLCLTDAELRLLVCNRQFRKQFALDGAANLQGTWLGDLIPTQMLPTAPAGLEASDGLAPIEAQAQLDRTYPMAGGTVISVAHEPMVGGGWVTTFEDITERKRIQDRIAHMAHHDPLTGLANRTRFWERTEEALGRLRLTGLAFAVLYLDLDRFKEVNDTLGHSMGDALLCAVAGRLEASTPPPNLVARLGGDEFAILFTSQGDLTADATALAERLLETISQPYVVGGRDIQLTTSVGISFAPKDGTSSEALIKKADLSLYQAKDMGANTYRCFAPEMEAKLWRRRGLEDDLRQALEMGQFQLFYQPLIALDSMRVVAGEALLRWNHPVHGIVSPGEFIPIAEDTRCIEALGEWVLQRAFEDATAWPDDVGVSVNLSPVQFKDPALKSRILGALSSSRIPAGRVQLEITESVLLQDTDANVETLRQLSALGFSIVLDDFGTGFSSLSYLLRFPFNKIKIDQSFVRGLDCRDDSSTIVQSVAALAKRLNMTTTAEGVETRDELNVVIEAGCTEAQGYYFNRPMPQHEFQALVLNGGKGMMSRAGPSRLR